MGGASSKAARSLPKSAPSSSIRQGAPTTSSSSQATPSRPNIASSPAASGPSPLRRADEIGQTGRAVSQNEEPDGTVGPVVHRNQGGSENKDDRIRRDAFDPDFVSQLNNLGPVDVPRAPWVPPSQNKNNNSSKQQQPARPANNFTRSSGPSQMQRILQARQERESALEAQQEQSTTTSNNDTHHMDVPTLTSLLDELKNVSNKSDLEKLCVSYDFDEKTLQSLTKRFNSPSIGEPVDSEEHKFDAERDSDRPPRIYAVWQESSQQLSK
ncbi:unnamed protein product [Sympodiomycopsis kandeliae]